MSSIKDDIQNGFIRRHGALGEIIAINVGLFIAVLLVQLITWAAGINGVVAEFVHNWLALPASPLAFLARPWTLFTYSWVHDWTDLLHVLFNMLWLFWIGRIFREYQGDRKIWTTLVLGSISAGLFYLLIENVLPPLRVESQNAWLIGASGGVTAVIVATATLLPDYRIGLLFFGLVRLKWIAIIMVLLDVLFLPAGNAGGRLAHLGGALFGYIYIVSLRGGTNLAAPLDWLIDTTKELFQPRTPRPKVKVVHRDKNTGAGGSQRPAGAPGKPSQVEVDRILDKIKKVGYDGLTKEEKQTLFNASR